MKPLLTLLAFAVVVWLFTLGMMGADGTLVNTAGTTTVGGSVSPGSYLTNNQSTATTISNAFTVTGAATNQSTLRQSGAATFASTITVSGGGTVTMGNSDVTSAGTIYNTPNFYWRLWSATSPALSFDQNALIGWGNGNAGATPDIGLGRNAAGVLEVNTGTKGTLAPIVATVFMLPTNYVAANFTPESGKVKVVSSNGILWKVTQLSTQLLDTAQSP